MLVRLKKRIFNKIHSVFNPTEVVENFLEKNFGGIIKKYQVLTPEFCPTEASSGKIWIFWWQGEESAPELIKKCLASARKNSNGHEVIVLTEKNIKNYCQIPQYIYEKVSSGKITLTHFSDIIRMEVLSSKGGLWLDATVYITRPICEDWFTMPYKTVRYFQSKSDIVRGRWTGFIQSALPGSPVQSFCRDIFYSYWEKFDTLIDYFLIDYVMLAGWNKIQIFKRLVNSVPQNNEEIKLLDESMNLPASDEDYEKILSSAEFFKLNRKRKYKSEADGKKTVYAIFMERG